MRIVPTIFVRKALENVACIALSIVVVCCNMKLVSCVLLESLHIKACHVLSLDIYFGKAVTGAIISIVDVVAQYAPIRVFDRVSGGVPKKETARRCCAAEHNVFRNAIWCWNESGSPVDINIL